jgi:hypothetical protein
MADLSHATMTDAAPRWRQVRTRKIEDHQFISFIRTFESCTSITQSAFPLKRGITSGEVP